jgi:transcriptional regulator with XRE-family HTH domain
VDGLTYREVAEELGVPLPVDFVIKGDHPAVRGMVTRGRAVLEGALGEEGWLTQIEAMRAESARWRSLNDARREAEAEAEALGIPYEKTLRCLEDEGDREDLGPEPETA